MKTLNILLVLAILVAVGGCTKNKDTADLQPVEKQAELKPTEQEQIQQLQDETQPAVTVVKIAEPKSIETVTPMPMGQNVYVIKKGDTLWSVAKTYLGDGQRWKDIVAVNPGLKPEAMSVGQQIILPAK